MVTHGSLFSGIGGFDLGLERAGIRTMWMCEIEPAARKVLAHHWPDTPCHGDVTEVDGARLEPVDVVTFGSPCQDLSVAGQRAGLDGARSGLFHEALRIAAEMKEATSGAHPRLLVWENVPGALSSNSGRDFAAVLDAMADVGAVDIGWRVLDAQWFGVAQRRRRVFVIADLGGRRAGQVLTLAQGSAWSPRPRRQEGSRVGALTANGVGAGGGPDDNAAQAGHLIPDVIGPLMARGAKGVVPGTIAARSGMQEKFNDQLIPESGTRVRRLTPVECERLQGFPDGWTEPAGADTHRYRCLGNAVCVNIAAWLGHNITEAL